MSLPLISVIIPIYNVKDYLQACLDSVVSQTYSNLEILCIVDGATDESETIARAYQASDNRVTVITQENKGVSSARNTGIEHANGSFLFFLDADDWLSNTAISKLYSAQQEYDVAVVSGAIVNYYEDADYFQAYKKRRTTGKLNLSGNNFYKLEVVVWNKLYRTEEVKNIRFKSHLIHQDEDYYWMAFSKVREVYAIPDDIVYYRRRKGSITAHSKADPKEEEHYIRIIDQAHESSKTHSDLKLQFLKCALKFHKRLRHRALPGKKYSKHLKDKYGIVNYYLSYIYLKAGLFIQKII